MAKPKTTDDGYGPEEAQRRFEAALRGARIAGHKPMKNIPAKSKSPPKKPRKKRA